MNGNDLRAVMRTFATGVCLVTTYHDGPDGRQHDAMTANSLLSVSLDPPLISLAVRRGSRFLDDLMSSRMWAVSILDASGEELARPFARDRDSRAGAVTELSARPGPATGALVVGAASWLECEYRDHLQVGDHTLVIGGVISVGTPDGHEPLIFVSGGYHRLGGRSDATRHTRAVAGAARGAARVDGGDAG